MHKTKNEHSILSLLQSTEYDRIHRLDIDVGNVETIAGQDGYSGFVDGTGRTSGGSTGTAELYGPVDVQISADKSTLYFSVSANLLRIIHAPF